MSEARDIAIAGTGAVGLAVAWELLQRGVTVAVIGPRGGEHRGQASRAAGAMLSTFSEIEPGHDPARVAAETAERLAAHDLYPAWLDRLGVGPARAGTWVVAPGGRRAWLAPIAAAALAAGHPAEFHDAGEVPGLHLPAESAGALWLPTEASIDSLALVEALTDAIAGHPGARWEDAVVVAVDGGIVTYEGGGTITAGQVVLAAGAMTGSLLPEGGRAIGVPPILAGRGVSLLLDAPGVPLEHVVRTPNAAFACGVHLVPRAGRTLYLGGTNRLTISPDPQRRPSVGELMALIGDAVALLDHRLATAEVTTARVGLRPYTIDHLPLIGRTGDPRVLLATATYRCGVLLAPRLAALVASEIEAPGALDAHPYRVLRPVATPEPEAVISGAAADLIDHLLQGDGHLSAQARAELAAFFPAALQALLARPGSTALRRLWQAAPVPEAIPSLLSLTGRPGAGQ
ncbi:MAG TPA: FAD-dependent oxidoreductase [Trebonia sp.]|nr:FAD-dependent oxidoreductase [Trebonia sp.]